MGKKKTQALTVVLLLVFDYRGSRGPTTSQVVRRLALFHYTTTNSQNHSPKIHKTTSPPGIELEGLLVAIQLRGMLGRTYPGIS